MADPPQTMQPALATPHRRGSHRPRAPETRSEPLRCGPPAHHNCPPTAFSRGDCRRTSSCDGVAVRAPNPTGSAPQPTWTPAAGPHLPRRWVGCSLGTKLHFVNPPTVSTGSAWLVGSQRCDACTKSGGLLFGWGVGGGWVVTPSLRGSSVRWGSGGAGFEGAYVWEAVVEGGSGVVGVAVVGDGDAGVDGW